MFRPDAENDAGTVGRRSVVGQSGKGQAEVADLDDAGAHDPGQEVHRRRTNEAGDEQGGRAFIEFLGRCVLLDLAALHHRDAGRQRHRLDLVVGDVDDGEAEFLVQLLDLDAHLGAQLGVEVRQRLVEQKELRVLHQRAPDGDALALAARELAGFAVEQGRESAAARRPNRHGG